MDHLVPPLDYGKEGYSPYRTKVAGLAAPFGIEKGLLENDIGVLRIPCQRQEPGTDVFQARLEIIEGIAVHGG
jgi:hypothetical protein